MRCMQAPPRRKRPGFQGFTDVDDYRGGRNGEWLLVDLDRTANYYEEEVIPRQRKPQDPKYINGKRVLANIEIT